MNRCFMVLAFIVICLSVCIGGVSGASSEARLEMRSDSLVLSQSDASLSVSLKCPRFVLGSGTVGGSEPPIHAEGDIRSGKPVVATYAPITLDGASRMEVQLHLQWFRKEAMVRKWVSFRVDRSEPSVLVKEIVLEDIDPGIRGVQTVQGRQSYPIFLDGFYAGVEFPIATTRIENGRAILAHQPGLRMEPGVWYESRRAVYGFAKRGDERRTFESYIERHRPEPKGYHFNYNHWWTTHIRANESDILGLASILQEKLYKPYGAAFDTFCIDLGWQNLQSAWEMDPTNFPDGFRKVRQSAESMGTRVGIWISPSSLYRDAMDNEWARQHGYETFTYPWISTSNTLMCMAGRKYQTQFKSRIVDMVRQYGVRSIKFDGFFLDCPSSEHGHEPGPLSLEAEADAIIDVFNAARKADPNVWLRTICFGWNPSPWWLFYTNSVLGTQGDDYPYGRVPCPIYRESSTTGRDFFNLQGASVLPIPIAAQDVMGVMHQTEDPLLNDAVMCIMRGHRVMPMYLNTSLMDDRRWEQIAGLCKWARRNSDVLGETEPIVPTSWRDGSIPSFTDAAAMPRQPYGYAHWKGDRGLIALRNPWIAPVTYSLKVDGHGLSSKARTLNAVSVYPEARIYGTGLKYGGTLDVHLAPYETLVLSISPEQADPRTPNASGEWLRCIQARVSRREVSRVPVDAPSGVSGPDWTNLAGDAHEVGKIDLGAAVSVDAPKAELLILLEDKTDPVDTICRLRVNGKDVEVSANGTESGWAATGLNKPEHWLFMRAPLPQGRSTIDLTMLNRSGSPKVSVWVWSWKDGPGGQVHHPNGLPTPERTYLDAVNLMAPVDLGTVAISGIHLPAPVERIDGVFLDALSPSEIMCAQDKLVRNKSIAQQTLAIVGKRHMRGLGTYAPSRIAVSLDGKYRRFQSWVGIDVGVSPNYFDRSQVNFEVWVDGTKRWESGPMIVRDSARVVDIDVSGAKSMELVTVDVRKTEPFYSANWANWADARLIR